MENSHRNIIIMFHTTSTAHHKEIIVATLVLDSCNIDQNVRFFLHVGRPNSSITVMKYKDSYSRKSIQRRDYYFAVLFQSLKYTLLFQKKKTTHHKPFAFTMWVHAIEN